MLRDNPPLLQHMLEDSLTYIAELLGTRLVRETLYTSNHDALHNFCLDLAFKFRQRVAQLGQQKGGLLTVQHQRALARADEFARGLTGDVPLAPVVRSAPPIRRARANPPLPEHMQSDELSDIASLLAERFVREVVANKDSAALSSFLGDLGAQFRMKASKALRQQPSDQQAAVLNAADAFAAELERYAPTSMVRRRANPPLSEHMAHDSLDEIASMLALRIAKAENPDAALLSFTRNLKMEVASLLGPRDSELQIGGVIGYSPKRRY